MDFFRCISLQEGRALIENALDKVRKNGFETVTLVEACGRITAEDVCSCENLPSFSRSTVDGFAVCSGDTFGAGEGSPALLELDGEIMMGCEAKGKVGNGKALAIPTGGMLPEGADAVIMLEHTERIDERVLLLLKPVAPGENVIRAGDDIRQGEVILAAGRRIEAQDIGALAACGITKVQVRKKLPVGVVSTGDELVRPEEALKPGQVRDANGPMLAALLREAGCQVKEYGIVRDDYQALRDCLALAAKECRIVVLSGGSSVGARDHTVEVLEELGEKPVLFHGLAVKPGKPTIFTMLGETAVFGLPGHPVAALTLCRRLTLSAVEKLQGVGQKEKVLLQARLTRNIASAAGRDDFVKVRLESTAQGYQAHPVLGKSGLLVAMTGADGEVEVAADKTGLYEDELVFVELIRKDLA